MHQGRRGKVLTEDVEIKERWQMFFVKLLNGEGVQDDSSRGEEGNDQRAGDHITCLLYTSPSPRDGLLSRMPSSA